MSEKKNIDWERIEVEYRAGILSLREIAAAHDISDTAIRKYAKGTKTRLPWERDLSAKIHAKAEAIVRADMVRGMVRKETATEREVVDSSASAVATVRISQRKDIQELRQKAVDYKLELDTCGEDLAKRVQILKALTEIQKTAIGLECQAFGISDNANGEADKPNIPTSNLSPEEAYKRLINGAA